MSKIRLRHSHPLLRGSSLSTQHGNFPIDHEGIFEVPTAAAHELVGLYGDINYADPKDAKKGSEPSAKAVAKDLNDFRAKIQDDAAARGDPKPIFKPEPVDLTQPTALPAQPPVLPEDNPVDPAQEPRSNVGNNDSVDATAKGKKGRKPKGKR